MIKQFNKIRGSEISMIFQDPMSSLDPVMKIGKQITEAMFAKENISKEEAKKKAIDLMAAVGIPEPEKDTINTHFNFLVV